MKVVRLNNNCFQDMKDEKEKDEFIKEKLKAEGFDLEKDFQTINDSVNGYIEFRQEEKVDED